MLAITNHHQAMKMIASVAETNTMTMAMIAPTIGTTVLMIKRTVGDGITIRNHRGITKIKIADQIDIHTKTEIIAMTDGVTAAAAVAAGDVIMIMIEKTDVIHIEAAVTRPANIVITRNPIEIICHQ